MIAYQGYDVRFSQSKYRLSSHLYNQASYRELLASQLLWPTAQRCSPVMLYFIASEEWLCN